MAEVATANGYLDYVQHWRNEVDRILFVELVFFIQRETKAPFEKRKAIAEVIAEYNTGEGFRKMLLFARKALAVRYLRQPQADLKLPDAETSRNAFWLTVSEAVSLALEES